MNDMAPIHASSKTPALLSIDCIRGYAILLVILSHVTVHVPLLPWPAKRIFSFGIYGVQLFFIASALTLMLSWTRSQKQFQQRCKDFYVSRLFRIVPLYYLAIPCYLLIENSHIPSVDSSTLLATLFFYNSWFSNYTYPYNPWSPVPGGWSISVEFSFYVVFPLLMLLVKRAAHALLLIFTFFILAFSLPYCASLISSSSYPDSLSLYLYYSPANQFIVFAIGIFLYFIIKSSSRHPIFSTIKINATVGTITLLVAVIALSFFPQTKVFKPGSFNVPTHLILSLLFAGWILIMISRPHPLVVNNLIGYIGKISFSLYICHFGVLSLISKVTKDSFMGLGTGFIAIAYFLLLALITTIASTLISVLTFRYIESPMIRLGKRLLSNEPNNLAISRELEPGSIGQAN